MRTPPSAPGSSRRTVRGLLTLLAGVLLGAGVLGLGVAPASAANSLESSTPPADAQLTTAPTQLQLTFVDPLGEEVTADGVGLAISCGGSPIAIGDRQIGADGRTVIAPITQIAPAGLCNVSWRLPDDSTGTFSFTIAPAADTPDDTAPGDTDGDTPATSAVPRPVDVEPTEPPKVGGMLGLSRMLAYLGLAALFGGLVLIALAWPEGVEYVLTLRFLRGAWLLALVTAYLNVVLSVSQATNDSIGGSLSPTAWGELFDTNPGRALVARLVLVAAAGWVALRPERAADMSTQALSLAIPALALATYGFSRTGGDLALVGHAAGAVHTVAMGVWIGGLALLARVVLTGPGDEDLVHAVRGFARLATPALLITVVTGAIQLYRLDSGGLFSSNHGRLMLLKGLAVVAMAYLGTLTRQVIAKRMARADHLDGRSAHRLRRAVSFELLLGVAVLGLTSWMLASRPPNVSVPSPASAYAFDRTLADGDFQVRISLDPARVGVNGLRVELLSPDEVSDLRVRLVPQQAPETPGWEIRVPLGTPGAATVDPRAGLTLGAPGVWNIEVLADADDGELPTLITAIVVPDPAGPSATTVPTATEPPATLPPVTAAPTETTDPADSGEDGDEAG